MTPIQTLIAKVEAGDIDGKFDPAFERAIYGHTGSMPEVYLASDAYHGSLDAAKALHEAVLPKADDGFATYIDNDDEPEIWKCIFYREAKLVAQAENSEAARAWLLCILKAMEDGE